MFVEAKPSKKQRETVSRGSLRYEGPQQARLDQTQRDGLVKVRSLCRSHLNSQNRLANRTPATDRSPRSLFLDWAESPIEGATWAFLDVISSHFVG